MQTILGAGGIIGQETAKALTKYTKKIRLVSRNPQKVNADDELISADLTNADQTLDAVKGSEIVYLTAGFHYNTKVWQNTWPLVMQNVLNACKTHKSKLVFFDNIYMYDSSHMHHITENTPIAPSSKKGEVRAKIANMLMDEVEKGNIDALIARAADFYGPSIKEVSVLTETVFNRLIEGKAAYWLVSNRFKHSFTYTPDAGAATALLGNTKDAYNQVWHLPTAPEPLTGQEWVEAIATELKVKAKIQVSPKWLVRIMGLFNPIMREVFEMLYQYDRDYVFDSSKFEKKFNISPTPYIEGIRNIVSSYYKN